MLSWAISPTLTLSYTGLDANINLPLLRVIPKDFPITILGKYLNAYMITAVEA